MHIKWIFNTYKKTISGLICPKNRAFLLDNLPTSASFGVTMDSMHITREFLILFYPLWFGFVQEGSERWLMNYGPKLRKSPMMLLTPFTSLRTKSSTPLATPATPRIQLLSPPS